MHCCFYVWHKMTKFVTNLPKRVGSIKCKPCNLAFIANPTSIIVFGSIGMGDVLHISHTPIPKVLHQVLVFLLFIAVEERSIGIDSRRLWKLHRIIKRKHRRYGQFLTCCIRYSLYTSIRFLSISQLDRHGGWVLVTDIYDRLIVLWWSEIYPFMSSPCVLKVESLSEWRNDPEALNVSLINNLTYWEGM